MTGVVAHPVGTKSKHSWEFSRRQPAPRSQTSMSSGMSDAKAEIICGNGTVNLKPFCSIANVHLRTQQVGALWKDECCSAVDGAPTSGGGIVYSTGSSLLSILNHVVKTSQASAWRRALANPARRSAARSWGRRGPEELAIDARGHPQTDFQYVLRLPRVAGFRRLVESKGHGLFRITATVRGTTAFGRTFSCFRPWS